MAGIPAAIQLNRGHIDGALELFQSPAGRLRMIKYDSRSNTIAAKRHLVPPLVLRGHHGM